MKGSPRVSNNLTPSTAYTLWMEQNCRISLQMWYCGCQPGHSWNLISHKLVREEGNHIFLTALSDKIPTFHWRSSLSCFLKAVLICLALIFLYLPLPSLAKLEEEFEKKFNSLPQYSPVTFDRKSASAPRKKKKVSSADQLKSNKGKRCISVVYSKCIAAVVLV